MAGIPVIDIFAGPGGLNEGFSALRSADGSPVFDTLASVEMDPMACRTLELRAAFRRVLQEGGAGVTAYLDFLSGRRSLSQLRSDASFGSALSLAEKEVHEFRLSPDTRMESDALISSALGAAGAGGEPVVLIGGPPCQAYSLAGRSRRKNDETFADDHKHVLYREYLHLIRRFRPAVFVMENVKGMLSSQHGGGSIFQAILNDLSAPGDGLNYEVRSFVSPASPEELRPEDFVIRSERYGVPQSRHRVILLGIRSDVAPGTVANLVPKAEVSVAQTIGDLPSIRSGLSPRRNDNELEWLEALLRGAGHAGARFAKSPAVPRLGRPHDRSYRPSLQSVLADWIRRDSPAAVVQHESRHHMASDLARYAYLASLAKSGERLPRVNEFPSELLPNHRNASRVDAPFADRFRVQLANRPSSTITSHIAKDGHYYIHPDPQQMRSLTVREAARLQTFPDNYFFVGSRTQQYHQVGNAVPPYLSVQLAAVVANALGHDDSSG
jgi:DNA (cytosine-5)-methyltransferase 1